ncbi:MAG: transcription factor, RsfA family protein [Bacillales bacterium]|jgi:predicted nuclease with TOPRIM domain|nr:transcription factor, RsfA family protein [Bacillales bacterium]
MTGGRQDSWSLDEDNLLAEVVLRYIREGSTQLKAFEEVGERLSRTAAACGFRWNSFVRKQFKDAIIHAKKIRVSTDRTQSKQIVTRKFVRKEKPTEKIDNSITLEQCLVFLQNLKANLDENPIDQIHQLIRKNRELQDSLEKLTKEKENLRRKFAEVSEDYQALLGFFEKARKLAVKETDHDLNIRFQMDQNGNLERV